MSADSAAGTPDVLGRVMGDPTALVDRIVRQVLEQLARRGDLPLDGEAAPEELVATALGDRLAGLIIADGPPAEAPAGTADAVAYAELLDRCYVLAAALGACECWGEDMRCRICGGEGHPGWLPPEPRLFARYVRPAMRAAAVRPEPARAAGNDREEGAHEEPVAG